MEEEIHWYFGATAQESEDWIRINESGRNRRLSRIGYGPLDLGAVRKPVVFLVGRYWERTDFPELLQVLRERQAIVTQLGNSLVGCGL